MKYIEKNLTNEPFSLKEQRSTPGSTFDDLNKKDIRDALLSEQGFLCAYCNQRISNELDRIGRPKTKIEHYSPQSEDERMRMNYLNMIGVCQGNQGSPKKNQHCDSSRGNQNLTINPMNPDCEELIKYDTTGHIYSENDIINDDLNIVLNLNHEKLLSWRKEVVKLANLRMISRYRKRDNQTWKKSDLEAEIKFWKARSSSNKFSPFCMAAVYYLKKKLARL
jgi:uncharacterized protein (TIGR02646 family)